MGPCARVRGCVDGVHGVAAGGMAWRHGLAAQSQGRGTCQKAGTPTTAGGGSDGSLRAAIVWFRWTTRCMVSAAPNTYSLENPKHKSVNGQVVGGELDRSWRGQEHHAPTDTVKGKDMTTGIYAFDINSLERRELWAGCELLPARVPPPP
jgi:hypothetical protein